MTLVFVSYARQDRDMALKLAERLRKAAPAGMEIAIDEAADGDLVNTASDTYRLPYVGRRLRNANAVVPVLTRSYAESDPCWLELSASLMMEKVVPISLDPGLSPAGISSMVAHQDVMSIAPGWFSKEPGEVEAFETAKFEMFVRELTAETERHQPFSEWQPAEPKEVRALAGSLAKALQPRLFRQTGLVWSPGSLSTVQKDRFFTAIESMTIATGEGVWDVARRKALKAMAAEPTQPRVRAEALMGLIGELTAPTDGSPPVTASEPWEFIGDFALPIDRDISRFAYTRAGKIPNELRKMFQVLRPGRSKRGAMFAVGTMLGGLVGVVMTYGGQMLFGQPGDLAQADPPKPDNSIASTPDFVRPPPTAQAPAPSLNPPVLASPQAAPPRGILRGAAPPLQIPSAPNIAVAPPSALPSPPAPRPALAVSVRGLEASVLVEMGRRGLDAGGWKEVYGEVISVNINTLCSPEKWAAAEAAGKKPLDLIDASTQLTWPTETDFATPSRLRECPVYRIPT
jgi:hypothetical protein